MTLTFSFDPIIAQIGPFQLGWHGLFTALAVVISIWLSQEIGRRRGIPAEDILNVATWGIVGGLVGARLFHVADHIPYYLANPLLIPQLWEGGIAVYGAFIGGIAGGALAAWRGRLNPWPLLDVAIAPMLVGQAIGRLGCLSNGDAWGAPSPPNCATCLSIIYTNPNDLLPDTLRGVPTYAYPVYEILAELALLVVLWLLRDRLLARPSMLFFVGAVGYAVIRFGLTFLRQETVIAFGLQEAQVIALVTGLVALAVLVWQIGGGLRAGRAHPASAESGTA